MIDSKLILLVIVILAVLAVVLGSNPTVSQFFSALGDKLSAVTRIEAPVTRNINFTLTTDKSPQLDFDSIRNLTLTIEGSTQAVLVEGNLNTTQPVTIINYHGTGAVADNLTLDGYFERLKMQDLAVSLGKENIKLQSAFNILTIENLAVKDVAIYNTTGTINISGSVTQFTGDVKLAEALGTFAFGNGTFSLVGTAQKISIPTFGINIG